MGADVVPSRGCGEGRIKYIVDLPPPPPVKEASIICDFPNCHKRFPKPSRLRAHQAIHSQEKPFKCSVPGCDASYYRSNHLKRHEATRHVQQGGNYMCDYEGCLASFETYQSLYCHQKRRHCQRKYACSFCPQMFSKKFLLKEHEVGHGRTVPFKCTRCPETFATHAALKSHQKLHRTSGETDERIVKKTYPCGTCGAIFDKWSNLISHKTDHKEAKMKCEKCDKTVMKQQLSKHMKTHEEANAVFNCSYNGCTRTYQHERNLQQHVRNFHEGSSFQCEICDRLLSTKQKLALHVKVVHSTKKVAKPKLKKRNVGDSFCRDKLIQSITTKVNFDVQRPGPPKGYRKTNDMEEAMDISTPATEETSEESPSSIIDLNLSDICGPIQSESSLTSVLSICDY